MAKETQGKNTLSKITKKIEQAIQKAPDWMILGVIGVAGYFLLRKFKVF